jgi:hypothetical protein
MLLGRPVCGSGLSHSQSSTQAMMLSVIAVSHGLYEKYRISRLLAPMLGLPSIWRGG